VGEVLGLEHKGAVRQRYKLGVATRVEARVNAGSVELWHEGRRVARHKRFSRQQQVLDLEHYLDVLERKPGAQAGSTALAQWRQAGSSFPFKLVLTLPKSGGTRDLKTLLGLSVRRVLTEGARTGARQRRQHRKEKQKTCPLASICLYNS
jgi:hypothetical protein